MVVVQRIPNSNAAFEQFPYAFLIIPIVFGILEVPLNRHIRNR